MENTTNKINIGQNGEKGPKPPYLSVVRLEELIKLASTRNFSDISPSLFENYGFTQVDALLAVSALKFLGLVDRNGKPTDLMPKLRLQGEPRKEVFKDIVRKAYDKLFAMVEKPYELSKDELSNEFIVNYNLSTRIVSAAIPVFLKLCEYAGLKQETKVRKVSDTTKKGRKEKKIPQDANFFPMPIAEGKMILNIPNELHTKILEGESEELNKSWRSLVSELKKFAENHLQDNIPEKETPEENSGES